MKEIWGVRLTDGKYHWSEIEPSRSARSRAHQASFRLNFRIDSSHRDAALSFVANDLADKGAEWAVPLGDPTGPWRLDLAKLSTCPRKYDDVLGRRAGRALAGRSTSCLGRQAASW